MKLHEEKHKEEMVAVEDGLLGSGIQVESSLRTGIQGNNSGISHESFLFQAIKKNITDSTGIVYFSFIIHCIKTGSLVSGS